MKITCPTCEKECEGEKGLAQHTQVKHPENIVQPKLPVDKQKIKKIAIKSIFILLGIIIVFGAYSFISNVKTLPPTNTSGHVEISPDSHILKEPMPIEVQKHMLEHADGAGQPGVIINYNCEDYSCETGLIEKLESFAEAYDFVYVAPFKNMDAKIALTKSGRIVLLDNYDNNSIDNFIRR